MKRRPQSNGKDRLLREARLRQAQAEALDELSSKTKKNSRGSLTSPLTSLRQFFGTITAIYETFLLPVISLFAPFFRLARFGYRTMYAWGVYGRRNTREFSRKRSASVVVSLFVGTLALTYFFVWHLVPISARFTYDAATVNLFSWEDKLVFGKPDWVEGEPGVLSVFACRRYPCSGQDDSVEFRIRDSVYLDIVRTFTKLEPHDPGELAGAFLSEENACAIKAYGVRVKYLHFYPYIFEAVCRPINKGNSQEILDSLPVEGGSD